MEPNSNTHIESPAVAQLTTPPSNTIDFDAKAPQKQEEKLRALGKTIGHIPNVPIFTQWKTRVECSNSAVHRPIMAGIFGNKYDGVYSVVLANAYGDDQDGGDVIFYTGAGGRERWSKSDPPRRVRLGPQTMDQSWDDYHNSALQVASLTGNPVRVIRSWKCPSQYAPLSGYRYDGLYKVASCWTAKGRNGKNICRCRLERLPDQPPIPLRPVSDPKKRYKERTHKTKSAKTESEEAPNKSNEYLRSISCQQAALPEPGALPRYRWDPSKKKLVKIHTSNPIAEAEREEDEEEHQDEDEHPAEDDATLVPSEDDHMQGVEAGYVNVTSCYTVM